MFDPTEAAPTNGSPDLAALSREIGEGIGRVREAIVDAKAAAIALEHRHNTTRTAAAGLIAEIERIRPHLPVYTHARLDERVAALKEAIQ